MSGVAEGQEFVVERVIANRALLVAAQNSSQQMDTYSGWMLAGFGGAFALLLANLDNVAPVLNLASLKWGAMWFLGAVMCGAAQKALAAVIASSAAAGIEGETIGRTVAAEYPDFNLGRFFVELRAAVLPPFRGLVERSFRRSGAGDHAAGGRLLLILAQIQGWLVLVESVLAISGAVTMLNGLTV